MKKLMAILFSTMLAGQVWAYDFQSGDLYYNITSSSTVAVTYQYEYSSSNYSGLTTVTIPEKVTGNGIEYSVTSIGDNAFNGCSSLASATIPESVTAISWGAFYGCSSLTTVTIPNSVTSIGGYAFKDCSSLGIVNFNAQKCTSIGKYDNPAFSGCTSLKTINIGENVENIPGLAFSGCSGLTSITIPNSVTTIGEQAFRGCSGLTTVNIGNSVTSIGGGAFNGCSSLTSISIPNSVTTIGEKAFCGCSGLTSVVIPESVTNIGLGAFSGCSSLTSITLPFAGPNETSSSSTWQLPFGYIFGIERYTGGTETSQTNIYAGSIRTDLFYIPTMLKEVIITGSSYIPYGAFSGCSNLTVVTIPKSVTTIGNYAFSGCSCTLYCEAPERPDDWGNSYDFSGTIYWNTKYKSTNDFIFNLTITDKEPYEVEILKYTGDSINAKVPSSVEFDGKEYAVTRIRNGAFNGYNNLDYTAYVNAYYIGNDENPYLVLMSAKNKKIESCNIHNQCRFIYDEAFCGCSNLAEISIPASVIGIGVDAFKDCGGLQKTEYASIADLCDIDFGNKYSNSLLYTHHLIVNGKEITEVSIPDSITSIGCYAFIGCDSLQKAKFVSVERLCNMNFGNESANPLCMAKCLYINGEQAINLVIPETVKSVGNFAFYNCTSIASLTISDSVKSIGSQTFYGCSRLASIEIPNSVTQIGDNAFRGCNGLKSLSYNSNAIGAHFNNISSLESIFIGDSIKNINGTEFNGCDNLVNVISMAAVPPTLNGDPYTYADVVYVPAASVDAYKSAQVWKRKEILPLDYYTVSVKQNNAAFGIVGGAGNYAAKQAVTVYALPAENYHFKAWSDGNTDNPRTMLANANMLFTAIFEGDEQTINVAVNSESFGSVTGAESYHYGDTVTFTAVPAAGYHFVKWSDDNTDNPRTIIITEDFTLSVVFEEDENQGGNNEGGNENQAGNGQGGETGNENQGGSNEGGNNQSGNNEGGNENQGGNEQGGDNNTPGGNWNNQATVVAENAVCVINIYVHGNTIVVENATDEIFVYNAMGALICRDAINRVRMEINVNTPGIYIVRTGGTVKRVMVK